MAKLKLFISHSSRLDDVNGAKDSDENWVLLQKICDEIKAQDLGVDINILVDQFIGSGEDWEKHLNLWLAECHAAIILYSKRALEQSDWVKKEATILNWRWQVEKNFPLLPVFFEGETNVEQAKKEFSDATGVAQINSITCAKTAPDIVNALNQHPNFKKLVSKLKSRDIPTPFSEMAEEIRVHLNNENIFVDLGAAWDHLSHVDKPSDTINDRDDLTNFLTQFLLVSPEYSLKKLQLIATELAKDESREVLKEAYGAVRAIWVHAGSAAKLPEARQQNIILTLNGNHLDDEASNGSGKTPNFTLDRFMKRVWQKERKGVLVTIDQRLSENKIESEIWKKCFRNSFDRIQEKVRIELTQEMEFIVLYIKSMELQKWEPDSEYYQNILVLKQRYQNLVVVLGSGEHPLEEDSPLLQSVKPPVDTAVEELQFARDQALMTTLA